jgi:hypothetical protein
MKKFIIPIAVCCLCACVNLTPDTGEDIDHSGHTYFGVDIENLSIGDVPVPGSWNAGDRIGVFGSDSGNNVPYYLKSGGEGLQAAAFYGGLVKGDVLAYAPYDEAASSASILCQLERVQAYQKGIGKADYFLKYNPRTFAVEGEDGVLHFKYPMGLLCVTFEFVDPITIQALSLKGKVGISGTLEATWDGDVRPSALSHKEISIDLGGNTVSSKEGGKFNEFLFVLPPAVYAQGDLTLEVVTTEEDMILALQELEIKRVDKSSFPVTSIEVKSSDLPGYEKEEGYLE